MSGCGKIVVTGPTPVGLHARERPVKRRCGWDGWLCRRGEAYHELEAENEQLRAYVARGIEVFSAPCKEHSGENAPSFIEFRKRYGERCCICDVNRIAVLEAGFDD